LLEFETDMLLRFFKWLLNKIGIKTLIAIALLLIVYGGSAYGFASFVKELDQGLLLSLVFLGIVLSWILAGSKIQGWAAAVLLTNFGIIFLFTLVGNLMVPAISLGIATVHLLRDILLYPPEIPIDQTSFHLAYAEVYTGVVGLLDPLGEWIISLFTGLPHFNETVISLIWGIVFWILVCWGGWSLRRYNRPLIGIIPTGILLSAGLAFTWSKPAILGLILFATLLLLAYANYQRSEKNWIKSNMDYPEDLPKDYSFTVFGVGLGIVLTAIILPVFSISSIVEIAYKFTQPQIEDAESVFQSIGLEQSSVSGEELWSVLRGGLPRGHLVGSGPELSEQLVMTVKITGGLPEEDGSSLHLPLYWRSLTYDEYLGSGWRSSSVIVRSYRAGEETTSPTSNYHLAIQQDFRIVQGKQQYLFAAGDIITSNQDFKIVYRPTPRYTEVIKAHGDFFGGSIDQSIYRVQSLIPILNSNDLIYARGEVPIWIQERYLTLPDTIPTRVFEFAKEITKYDVTPYDKARTLENHLRTFEYTLDVEALPIDTDMVDYFLFDLKKGYCDYYATAMAVMARGLGIPARLAIGYTPGTYDDVNNRYIVTEANAHSWVEIYFQGIGWVPFEPTAGRESFEPLTQEFDLPEIASDLELLDAFKNPKVEPDPNWSLLILSIGIGFCVIVLGIFLTDIIRINYLDPMDGLALLYQRLFRYGTSLKVTVNKDRTPLEFVKSLESKLLFLSDGTILRKTMISAIPEIHEFTQIYTLSIYSSSTLKDDNYPRVKELWRNLRRKLIIARLRQITYRKPR
jgi:hypothetical protein